MQYRPELSGINFFRTYWLPRVIFKTASEMKKTIIKMISGSIIFFYKRSTVPAVHLVCKNGF